MPAILYRCPNTGDLVQHFFADEPDADEGERYDPVECPACAALHFVNPSTGKVLGDR
jgi:hypothetical protein